MILDILFYILLITCTFGSFRFLYHVNLSGSNYQRPWIEPNREILRSHITKLRNANTVKQTTNKPIMHMFTVTPTNGFLPYYYPLRKLPMEIFAPLEKILSSLPELLRNPDPNALRTVVRETLPLYTLTYEEDIDRSSTSTPTDDEDAPSLSLTTMYTNEGNNRISIHHPVLAQALLRDYSILTSAYLLERKTKLTNGSCNVPLSLPDSDTVPRNLAVPLAMLSKALHQPMIMEYSSYCLGNFYSVTDRFMNTHDLAASSNGHENTHPTVPVTYAPLSPSFTSNEPYHWNNLRLIRAFDGGPEESSFILIHSEIESQIGPLIRYYADALTVLQQIWTEILSLPAMTPTRTVALPPSTVLSALNQKLLASLTAILTVLDRIILSQLKMYNASNPRNYTRFVRPWIFGWKNNPDFPNGVTMEGIGPNESNVSTWLRGETGAQSTIIPSFDTFFGIVHSNDNLRIFLTELEEYRPLPHKEYLSMLRRTLYPLETDQRPGGPVAVTETGNADDSTWSSSTEHPSHRYHLLRYYLIHLHSLCTSNGLTKEHPLYQESLALIKTYNQCIHRIWDFRAIHVSFADLYIQRFTSKQYATGGTPYKSYLRKHRDESIKHQLSSVDPSVTFIDHPSLPSAAEYEQDMKDALDESKPERNGIPRHLYERYYPLIIQYYPEYRNDPMVVPSLTRICYPSSSSS